jgi:hypothetical protein
MTRRLTIAKTSRRSIRCTGRLSCSCGAHIQANDLDLLEDDVGIYAGKCTLIACALTIIERSLLDQRPAFFVTAGRRGSGKTTTLTMLIEAVTGIAPAAFAWSPNEEERRKALMSYLLSGIAYILWDNIARGTQISCPHIEKSCTAAYYADRKLGVSEMVLTAAASIHLFTGNNVSPKGDLASRSLQVRLDVDRVDPENRDFKHPDPTRWTRAYRAEVLQAFYTILLGNPTLEEPRDAPMKTRFKMWWRIVGSAVEHAAQCDAETDPDRGEIPDQMLDFGALFLDQEAGDDDAASLGETLEALDDFASLRGAPEFGASDVVELLNKQGGTSNAVIVRSHLFPGASTETAFTPNSVGKRLKAHVGEVVKHGDKTLVLKVRKDGHTKNFRFWVAIL